MGKKLREELQYTTRILAEENRKGKKLIGELIATAAGIAIGGIAAYNFLKERDEEAPQIERLDFRERVEKGKLQDILVCVRERNPSKYATLKLNGTSIEIPLSERSSEKACYSTSFNPSSYFGKEGNVHGELILADKFGNSVSKDINFLVNLEAPKIADVRIEREGIGEYKISAVVNDENLRNVYAVFDNTKIPLSQKDGRFEGTVKTFKDLNLTLFAEDKFNMSSSFQGKIDFSKDNPNVAYALQKGLNQSYVPLIAPLDNDAMQDLNEKSFVDLIANNTKILPIPTFYRYVSERASDGKITDEELKYSSNFASLVNRIHDNIYEMRFRVKDPIKIVDYSSGLGLRLNFDKELAKDATAKALSYYGIAVVDRKLPENLEEISLLTKATQIDNYGDKLVDFSPIVFHSIDGNNYVLIPDAGRESWMLARHMKLIEDSGFNILNHPEMFEGLNGKIIANAYSIFDAKYGINYAEQFINGRVLKPTDKDTWDLIMLQWNLYSNKAPQLGGRDKLYNRDFPWYDSDKLDLLYQDANNRRQALFFLFFLDNGTFDFKRDGRIAGLEGARRALIQAEEEYKIISSLYPDGKIGRWNEDPRNFYYGWLIDRQNNGLANAVYQFVGVRLGEYRNDPEFRELAAQRDAIDQHLGRNWKYWDLVRFAMGYEGWKHTPNMLERDTINYTIPQVLKAFGFPTYHVYILSLIHI